MISKNENYTLWEQRINEKNKSGLTIKEWCEKNGISRHKYNYWNHLLIKRNEKTVEETTFTEVTTILSKPDNTNSNLSKSYDFQILYKNIQVTVPSNFNQDSLAGLMKVLQDL
ncbi:hypothetical protein C1I91_04755 [Clostridium manihotivorum]|uniref:Transposase n=1 Tax=Clostridium manihotivorum TaxID=2320868 RepID=A0A410DPP0_9CLOT|nr:hypothetical protein C1I91_04755 [Clostridium manihotivorum]